MKSHPPPALPRDLPRGGPPLLYAELVSWYRLVDPIADHADEADCYQAAIERFAAPRPETLLELGSGAGHNAYFLKRRFRCTLADVSAPMQSLSRELNPECEHVIGDMRSVRLGRTFDAVFVHDAVVYMLTESDLEAAARTAFAHTRPGGAAVFAPDYTRERFRETSILIDSEEGARSLRGVEWVWDPDPADDTYLAEYALLLREAGDVRVVHDRHVEAMFPIATWRCVLERVGFRVETFERPLDDDCTDLIFVGRRPDDER